MFIEKEQDYSYYSILYCIENTNQTVAYIKTIYSKQKLIDAFLAENIYILNIIDTPYQEDIDYIVLD